MDIVKNNEGQNDDFYKILEISKKEFMEARFNITLFNKCLKINLCISNNHIHNSIFYYNPFFYFIFFIIFSKKIR